MCQTAANIDLELARECECLFASYERGNAGVNKKQRKERLCQIFFDLQECIDDFDEMMCMHGQMKQSVHNCV